ncbi:hypothetical protein ACIRL3_46430 [Streptomyces sp. NPDC102384]|uniref:hypothetical protein n=1 Tax=Streptomyces sp. NPDC102384 TaxID=3366166 RepID=UPI0038303DEE
MIVTELLRLLQAEHDGTAGRADHLRGQIGQLTTALAEAEARLAELGATSTSTCPPTSPRPTSPAHAWGDPSAKDSFAPA